MNRLRQGAMKRRRQLVAGNWKMNGLRRDLDEIARIGRALGRDAEADMLLCPPATLLMASVQAAGQSSLTIGAQDCRAQASGAFTGDISAEMIRDAGGRAIILGHSERRTFHGELSRDVRAKAEACHRAGLLAIICIGETAGERRAGLAVEVCRRQLQGSLPESAAPGNTAIAYEPVWAIGTGLTPTLRDVKEMHSAIRASLPATGEPGGEWRILYGGSVKPENAASLLALAEVDGVLVGGASLNSADFLAIASASRTPLPQ
jgi:triosephosphate isomerase